MEWIALIEALASVLGATAWPIVAIVFLLAFRKPLVKTISRLSSATIKAGDIEANLKYALELGAALGEKNLPYDPDSTAKALEENLENSINLLGKLILWVDDRPENNKRERQALETKGIRFIQVKSTEDALKVLETSSFDLIISDMGRPGDNQAGYTLLSELRKSYPSLPYIIYAGEKKPEQVEEAKRRTASGTTNRPDELIQMVESELKKSNKEQ